MANENQKYTVVEVVEGKASVFCHGLKKDKNGKTIYLKQVKGADGKPDTKKTKVMVQLCLPASKENENEQSKFISAAITLENATKIKEAGVDLGKKLDKPLRVRYSIQEWQTKNDDGTYTEHMMREIVNVGTYNAETKEVDWAKKPQPKPTTTQEAAAPETVEVQEDDLPF